MEAYFYSHRVHIIIFLVHSILSWFEPIIEISRIWPLDPDVELLMTKCSTMIDMNQLDIIRAEAGSSYLNMLVLSQHVSTWQHTHRHTHTHTHTHTHSVDHSPCQVLRKPVCCGWHMCSTGQQLIVMYSLWTVWKVRPSICVATATIVCLSP